MIGIRVSGEGPRPCPLMLIGEFPGIDEGRRGRPFIGKSGRELMRYLNGYDLPERDAVYLTNFSKIVAKDASTSVFTPDDERALIDECVSVRPSTIVTLGARVTRYFLGDVTLEQVHGIPHRPRPGLATPQTWIFPTYNPAAMLHSPALQSVFAADMKRLALHLRRKLPAAPVDAQPGHYSLYPGDVWTALPSEIAMDSEGWADRPWCLSYTGAAYRGEVVRYGQHTRFVNSVRVNKPRIIIHNALHDLPVFRAFGLDLDEADIPFDDTMVMAYLLGLEPQGLKDLAYRHAGMQQEEYADLTAEAAEHHAFTWLLALHDRLPDKPEKLTKRDAVARGLWDPASREKYIPVEYPVLTPDEKELARLKGLVARMIEKPGGLRTRWANCRTREVLVEELYYLPPGETDPPDATLDDVPLDRAVRYAGRDADATFRIKPYLAQQIDAYDLREVYAVDMAILPMIERMQVVGLKTDVDHFRTLSIVFQAEAEQNLLDLEQMAGYPINPNSGDQVAELLFERLELQNAVLNLRLKRTEGGRFSTNDKTLDALKAVHPIVPLIQEGREIRKLKGTYADPIPFLVGGDGRLHPRYRITRTDTGRLSAGDPNVLAFPKHSARGKLIRDGFVADDGHELGEWDLAQIEMCVFAHDSEDVRMIAEILSGVDKHAATAAGIFGRPAETIYAESKAKQAPGEHQRFAAKAINFGILMGITEHGLLDQFHKNGQTHYDLSDTEQLLREWFRMYPQAKTYIERKHAEARRYGYVRDMWGRLRWLEGIHADDDYIRAEAERMAQATPTQSGAQGIIKRVMREVWPTLKILRRSFWVEPLLQVHDALMLEYDLRRRDEVNAIMMGAMTGTVALRVPVKASASFGSRWGEL